MDKEGKMDSRIIKQASQVLALTVSLAVMGVGAMAQEFEADVTRTMKGKTEHGKLFVKGGKNWTDLAPPSMGMGGPPAGNVFMITDRQTGKLIVVNRDEKSYSEMPMGGMADPEAVAKMVLQMGGEITEAGSEKVAGYMCQKVIYAYPDKRMGRTIQWKAADLGGYTLKTVVESPYMSMTMEVKNIKKTEVPESKFNIPAGYRKIDSGFGMR